jgi:hypothetical protein
VVNALVRVDTLGCAIANPVPEADSILAKLIEQYPGIEGDEELTYGFAVAATERIWDMPSFGDYRDVFMRHGIRVLRGHGRAVERLHIRRSVH